MKKYAEIDLNELIGNLSETSDPIMRQYFLNLEKNKLLINGVIDLSAIEMYVMPLIQWDNDESVEHIHIYVNCYGGVVEEGMAVAETINKLKTKTTVELLAHSASMGGFIACAGMSNPNVKVVCHEFSTFLIHQGQTNVSGNSASVDDTIDFYRIYNEKMEQFMLRNSKITHEMLKAKRRDEWYLTSEEMLKYGLVDEII